MGSQTHTGSARRSRFPASLIAVCAVAAVDLAFGQDTVLVELLIGPVIAAFGASPGHRHRRPVRGCCRDPAGRGHRRLRSSDQLIRLAAVGLVSGLAVGIARLRSDRERDAARLAVQYGVARVLAEADSLEAAGTEVAGDREPPGWDVGHLWEVVGDAPAGDRPGCATASRRPSSRRRHASWSWATASGCRGRLGERPARLVHERARVGQVHARGGRPRRRPARRLAFPIRAGGGAWR